MNAKQTTRQIKKFGNYDYELEASDIECSVYLFNHPDFSIDVTHEAISTLLERACKKNKVLPISTSTDPRTFYFREGQFLVNNSYVRIIPRDTERGLLYISQFNSSERESSFNKLDKLLS